MDTERKQYIASLLGQYLNGVQLHPLEVKDLQAEGLLGYVVSPTDVAMELADWGIPSPVASALADGYARLGKDNSLVIQEWITRRAVRQALSNLLSDLGVDR